MKMCLGIVFVGLLSLPLSGCMSQSRFEPATQHVRTERLSEPASEVWALEDAEGVVIKPDGTITASAGNVSRTKVDASEDIVSEASYTGPGVSTSSEEAASKIRSQSPTMTPESIGKGSISALSELATGGGFSFFYILGAVGIAGGVLIGYFAKNIKLGLMVAGVGLLFIGVGVTISQWPWIWLVVVAAVVVLVAYMVWQNRDAFRNRLALDTIVKGVEKAPDDAKSQVKESIDREANGSGSAVKSAVNAAKARA